MDEIIELKHKKILFKNTPIVIIFKDEIIIPKIYKYIFLTNNITHIKINHNQIYYDHYIILYLNNNLTNKYTYSNFYELKIDERFIKNKKIIFKNTFKYNLQYYINNNKQLYVKLDSLKIANLLGLNYIIKYIWIRITYANVIDLFYSKKYNELFFYYKTLNSLINFKTQKSIQDFKECFNYNGVIFFIKNNNLCYYNKGLTFKDIINFNFFTNYSILHTNVYKLEHYEENDIVFIKINDEKYIDIKLDRIS